MWGESGRYPLIYQSIRLCLNYFKRLEGLPKGSFVHSALKEQKSMNLPWFKSIEPLLKIDELFHIDHVSADKIINPTNYSNHLNQTNTSQIRHPFNKLFRSLNQAKPLPSKKFRVQTIFNELLTDFKKCWEYDKASSSKLSFYNSCKLKFGRESYLDVTKGFTRRINTTKLRISAHDLEIERGRYKNLPKENRICHWCKTCLDNENFEDEKHMLFYCDLYATLRIKLITQLNNTPIIPETIMYKLNLHSQTPFNINTHNFPSVFQGLLSQNTNINNESTTQLNLHHILQLSGRCNLSKTEQEFILHRRSYIINCICTYIMHCFEKRTKYLKQLKEASTFIKTVILHFTGKKL